VESYAQNPRRTVAQRFISRDFNGLVRMTAERLLPPGQREVRKWPRLDLGIVPRFDPKEWDLRVDGSVDKPIRFTYDEFLRLPSAKVVSAALRHGLGHVRDRVGRGHGARGGGARAEALERPRRATPARGGVHDVPPAHRP